MVQKCFQPLLNHPNASKIISIFESEGHEIRFVGGAVRDCLAGREVHDIDLATTLEPKKVLSLLEGNRVKVVPTGIDHGTVTAVINEEHFEITTLRKDIETDGRRAVVSFTTDWFEDATRRDFTFNAMSLTSGGQLFDPFEGQKDLENGHVKFIGHAEMRIKEDALRIMRFFRFHAIFGKGKPDKEALNSCLENRGLLDNLSAERVRQEVLKLLETKKSAETWGVMLDNAILANVLPHAYNIRVLERLIDIEVLFNKIDPLRRFISLYRPDMVVVSDIAHRMTLTKKDMARFKLYKMGKIPPDLATHGIRDLIPYLYRYGSKVTLDGMLIGLARIGADISKTVPDMSDKLLYIESWERPVFPLSGHAVMEKFNIPQGKQLGEILKECETMWVDNAFSITAEELLVWAKNRFFPNSDEA